jgi:hypothetical protein
MSLSEDIKTSLYRYLFGRNRRACGRRLMTVVAPARTQFLAQGVMARRKSGGGSI